MTDGARAVGRVLALDGPDGYTGAMSFRSILTSFGLSVLLSTLVSGDEFPDSAEAFPPSAELPDLFTFRDGGAVSGREDWGRRRDELIGMLMHYQYGTVPPKPDLVTARVGSIREHPSGLGTVNELTLMIGSEAQLPVRAVLYKPVTPGPHPVIIKEEGRVGRSRYAPLFLEKNYILIEYANGDLDPGREGSAGPAQVAFPGYDWGMLAAWAWGGMRPWLCASAPASEYRTCGYHACFELHWRFAESSDLCGLPRLSAEPLSPPLGGQRLALDKPSPERALRRPKSKAHG